jgi:predicted ATPase/class 3 adenylate cyclase
VVRAPSGTVTFLFTDIEGSTRLWDEEPDAAATAIADHDRILRASIERHGGYLFSTSGDGVVAAFARAADALEAAVEIQRAVLAERLPAVRMAVHTGEAEERDGNYFGAALNRAARMMSLAHGGQILASASVEAIADRFEFSDRGIHKLRDLARPEQVYQVQADGLPTSFPPLRSVDEVPTNLRPQFTSFVGRTTEVEEVSNLVRAHRLVTLTGVGGVGKTRLATEVAELLLTEFPDGVWLCELAPVSDDDSVAQVVASTIGASPRPGRSITESVVERLHARTALVVLDNCEHLLRPAAELAELLAQEAPEVRVLATSREGLAVAGEHLVALRSLPTDAAEGLFADRASAVDQGFVLHDEATAVNEICRRLDGIPLAIELAAARAVAMSPADIAAHLDQRFQLLTGGRRTAVERHQTLLAAVQWSYDLLEPTERAVFERLGVFAGSFDAKTACEVAAGDDLAEWDVLDALTGLVAKSLVVAERRRGALRYELLETLRQFAVNRLGETDLVDRWRQRHARAFAARTEAIAWRLVGPDEVAARAELIVDLDNIRAAVAWALDCPDQEELAIALRIIALLCDEPNMMPSSGVGAWAERALDHLEGATSSLRSGVLAAAAYQAHHRGDNADAMARAKESIEIGVPGDLPSPATAYSALSIIAALSGEPKAAIDTVSAAEPALRAAGASESVMARFLGGAVSALMSAGEKDHAWELAHRGLALANSGGNPSIIATCEYCMGAVLTTADPDQALAWFDRAAERSQELAFSTITGPSLYQSAYLRAKGGEMTRALIDLRASVAMLWEVGQEPQLNGAFGFATEILVLAGRPAAAFVIVGAISRGPLHTLREMPVPPERDPSAAIRAARDLVSDEDRRAAMELGASMTYAEMVVWLLETLDETVKAR